MKRKNPTIQSSYGEIFQPDVMPQWQLWGGCIVLIAALIPLIIWSIQGDDPILPGVTALLAVIFVLFEGKNVMVNRRNRALAFGVTPWQLTMTCGTASPCGKSPGTTPLSSFPSAVPAKYGIPAASNP